MKEEGLKLKDWIDKYGVDDNKMMCEYLKNHPVITGYYPLPSIKRYTI